MRFWPWCKMNPNAPSFEAMIGLALRGSNWQQLQDPSRTHVDAHVPTPTQQTDELEADSQAGQAPPPRLMTAKQHKKMRRFEQTVARDAGKILHTIEVDAITPVAQNVTWDNDPELLCSYNWRASVDGTNTIYVPGAPTKWQEPSLPFKLEHDSGIQYSDYNYARQPRDPYAPMFHALSVMNPSYQLNDVDVLADRNNLRVLLEFCQGKSNGPFRLNVFCVLNTLVIVRKESKWWKACDGVSYGWNFEKHFTRPLEGLEDATSHYRAIRYPLGPLNVVVRFEADAFDDGIASDILTESETDAVSGTSTGRPTFNFKSRIRVLQKGHIIPSTQMVELKTQKYDPKTVHKVLCQDQLWFGRTSLLFTGRYQGDTGVINRVSYEVATDRIKIWEERYQESLRKLPALLMYLRDVLKKQPGPNRAVVLLREDKGGPLSIRSMEGLNQAISRDHFMKHWGRSQASFGSHGGNHQSPHADKPHGSGPRRGSHTRRPHTRDQFDQAQNRGTASNQVSRGQRGRGREHSSAPRGRGYAHAPIDE